MRFDWYVEHRDIEKVKKLFDAHKNSPFVQKRIERNLNKTERRFDNKTLFKTMVACLLTTQQRSGPESQVTRFINTEPFPLSYDTCISQDNLKQFVQKVISGFGGIRRSNRIADEVSINLSVLEQGLWNKVFEIIEELQAGDSAERERGAADFINDNLKGFGPKQSRNFLQSLGLTQYEIPIDSRITKWLNRFGFPVELSSTALSDQHYYKFVSEGLQKLCKESDIKPCVLDAVIFVSYDGDSVGQKRTLFGKKNS